MFTRGDSNPHDGGPELFPLTSRPMQTGARIEERSVWCRPVLLDFDLTHRSETRVKCTQKISWKEEDKHTLLT